MNKPDFNYGCTQSNTDSYNHSDIGKPSSTNLCWKQSYFRSGDFIQAGPEKFARIEIPEFEMSAYMAVQTEALSFPSSALRERDKVKLCEIV